MRWSYKTIHFELKKEGLLGGAFLDVPEIEQALNEYGRAGWELVSIIETGDGLVGVLKQPIGADRDQAREEIPDSSALTVVPPLTETDDLASESEASDLPAELPEEAALSEVAASDVHQDDDTGGLGDSCPEETGELRGQGAEPAVVEVTEEISTLPSVDEEELSVQPGVWEVSGEDALDDTPSAAKPQSAAQKDDRHDDHDDDHVEDYDLGVGSIRIE